MSDEPEMTPERQARLVRVLLVISPFGAAFAYGLAAIQRAEPAMRAMMAGIMFVGCLAAALLFHLRGAKAGSDSGWIALILRLLSRR